MRLRSVVRAFFEQGAPALASGLRALREEIRAHGQRLVPTPYGFMLAGDASMQNGTFEPGETALLQRCIEGADVFIDVGANIGLYACLSRKAGKHTLAIEPLADNLRTLYRNLQANGWDDVEVWPLAVSSHPGLLKLYGAQTGASLVPGWAGASAAFNRMTAVTTLDVLVGRRFQGQRLAIKIDVEGAEYRVLQGATSLLTSTPKPVWLIEITRDLHHPAGNPDFGRTFELMRSFGYSAYQADAELTPVTPDGVERLMDRREEAAVNSWLFSETDPRTSALEPSVPRGSRPAGLATNE